MKKTAPLSTPTSSSSRARVVGRDLARRARGSAPGARPRRSGPRRRRARARSCVTRPAPPRRPARRRSRAPRRPRRRARRAASLRGRSAGSSRRRTRPGSSSSGRRAGRPGATRVRSGPGSSERMRHAPQRTSPSSSTGLRSSQRRSCSRTACTPPPRSTRFEPTGESSSSASAGGSVRALLERAQDVLRARPDGCCSSSGRISSRISPRTVSGSTSRRGTRSSRSRQYASVSSRQSGSSGRTTPSSRRGLMPLRLPARHEAVEDRLDLVVGRVAGRAQPVGRAGRSGSRAARPRSRRARRSRRPRRRAPRAQKRASSSDSSPRRQWFTCSAETR